MRLCRFLYEGTELSGFYRDDSVIPLDLAAEAHGQATGHDLVLPISDSLLDLLPTDGPGFRSARQLADWLTTLNESDLHDLTIPTANCSLLVPIPNPPKLLLLAGNYPKHIEEHGGSAAERAETFPYVFSKPPSTTLTNPGDPILIPASSPDHIDWECELAVVIGRRCRNVPESDALNFVAGYTVVNDVSDRKFRPNPGRKARERDVFFDWLHGKWHDTFCPMGPCILSADSVPNPQDLEIRLEVNGQRKQHSSTSQMVFPVAAVIAFLSSFLTLEPGDVISTGTPSGVGSARGEFLKPGDLVRASISGIGTLENPVSSDANEGASGNRKG
jgi:2-keto-4-pentenoate hydratase/2-oxohepta-3-ene-1,7-dioic acid hydratase in catechol pathway